MHCSTCLVVQVANLLHHLAQSLAHYLEAQMIDYKAAELQSSCLSGTDVPLYVEWFAS